MLRLNPLGVRDPHFLVATSETLSNVEQVTSLMTVQTRQDLLKYVALKLVMALLNKT